MNYYREIQRYKEDTKFLLYGGLAAIGLVYFIISRPSFPMYGQYTWSILLGIYGMTFYVGFSLVAGWRLLNKMTANMFLFLPLIGWVIYFFIKLALAATIGVSCFYGIFRLINNSYQIYTLEKQSNAQV